MLKKYFLEIIVISSIPLPLAFGYYSIIPDYLGYLISTFLLFSGLVFIGIDRRQNAFLKKIETPKQENIRFIVGSQEPILIISECISNADGDICVYGRGPASLDWRNEGYMSKILEFLQTKEFSYYRLLIVSPQCRDSSFLWLYFLKCLMSHFKEKVHFRVFERELYHDVFTPFQIVGTRVTHYVTGFFNELQGPQVANMLSTFYFDAETCKEFNKLFMKNIWVSKDSKDINEDNIDEYLLKYQKMNEPQFVKDVMAFIKKKFQEHHIDIGEIEKKYLIND